MILKKGFHKEVLENVDKLICHDFNLFSDLEILSAFWRPKTALQMGKVKTLP